MNRQRKMIEIVRINLRMAEREAETARRDGSNENKARVILASAIDTALADLEHAVSPHPCNHGACYGTKLDDHSGTRGSAQARRRAWILPRSEVRLRFDLSQARDVIPALISPLISTFVTWQRTNLYVSTSQREEPEVMSQPEWELVYATDYSALYRDKTGVYPPELAIAQTLDGVDEDDIEAIVAYVYRFPLERCWQVREFDERSGTMSTFLTDMNPARAVKTGNPYKDLPYPLYTYKPWFRDSLGDVARSCGETAADLIKRLCSDDPNDLARAYQDIGGYHGFANFDEEPNGWTEHEFDSWPERGEKLPDWSDELKAHKFTLDEKTEMSRAFDAGNYGHAYESENLEDHDLSIMQGYERAAFVLGFFGSYSLDEIGSDREIFDECYWSAAGHHVVKVAQYTDCRGEEYLEDSEGADS